MAVVINDFEVVSQPAQNQSAAATAAPNTATGPAEPKPQDIERAVRRQQQRLARVRAH
jgi:hypothetical protein